MALSIENEVIDTVTKAIRAVYSTVKIYDDYPDITDTLPCVTINQAEDSTYQPSMTSGNTENHILVAFDINIYTNKSEGKKQEAKAIANTIKTSMSGMGFIRTFNSPLPNPNDISIYRRNMKYSAVVSNDKHTYSM